jgi:hypothetical protein
MGKEYRDVVGYEGIYKVSNDGDIYNIKFDRKLSVDNSSKYPMITLSKNNNKKRHLIHRLVATAFIPNPDDKKQVNHINGVKDDNRLCNLEWVTASENITHAFREGLKTPSFKSKLKKEDVSNIKLLLAIGVKIKDISNLYMVSCRAIRDIKNKKTWESIKINIM